MQVSRKMVIFPLLKAEILQKRSIDLDPHQASVDPSSITLRLRIPETLEEDQFEEEEMQEAEFSGSEGMESEEEGSFF